MNFSKILINLGTNNSAEVVAGLLALSKMLFMPLATLSDKKATPEQKRYTITRDIITEALAFTTYIGVTSQVQKHATAPICSAYYKNKAELIKSGKINPIKTLTEEELKFLENVDSKKIKEIGEHYLKRLSSDSNEIAEGTKEYGDKLNDILTKINGAEEKKQAVTLSEFKNDMRKNGIPSKQKGLSVLLNDFKNGAKSTQKVLNPEKLFLNTRISISQVSVWLLALAIIPGICNVLIRPIMKKFNPPQNKIENANSHVLKNVAVKPDVTSKPVLSKTYAVNNGSMRV